MTRYLNKSDLELIKGGFDFWDNNLPINRDVIISYLQGAEMMLKYKDLKVARGESYTVSGLMCSYLWNKYKIKHINLERTLNQLAIIKQKDWIEMFIQVFDDFQKEINWDLGFAKLERDSIFKAQAGKQIAEGIELDEYKSRDGIIIQKGTRIQLGNLMKEDYQNTLFFDSELECPEWDLLIPSKKSFQFVNFLHETTLLGNVVGAYSLMTAEVSKIYRREDKIFIQSNHFEIELEGAISNSELLIGQNMVENKNQEWQELNMVKFHEKTELYIQRLITDEEFWTGIIGFDINAPFYGRKERKRIGYGGYGTSIKTRWSNRLTS